MQDLLTSTKKSSVTDPYLKEKPDLRKEVKRLDYYQRATMLNEALIASILLQMKNNPDRFHPDTQNQAYAEEFANHFLDKIIQGKVVALNETVVEAFQAMGWKNVTLRELYDFMSEPFPEMKREEERPKEEKKFRGC